MDILFIILIMIVMLIREYRILMPLSVSEYKKGQRYMIARAQLEAGFEGDRVELVGAEPCQHAKFGAGIHQEKRYHLARHLPFWAQKFLPTEPFYVTENSWNYYPRYNETNFTCHLSNRISVEVQTTYQDDAGNTDNALNLTPEELAVREVVYLDLVYDEMSNATKEAACSLKGFKSEKIDRGPFAPDWPHSSSPVMCSYKVIRVNVNVFGFQTIGESTIHGKLRDVLLQGHKEAVLWLDEWYDITEGELVELEERLRMKPVKNFEDTDIPDTSTVAEGGACNI